MNVYWERTVNKIVKSTITETKGQFLKKEIVYVGDVLNTTSRIQNSCKRFKKDFLISADLVEKIGDLSKFTISFIGNKKLRGKEREIGIYGLEMAS